MTFAKLFSMVGTLAMLGGAFALSPGCSNQAEGERCDRAAGDADCQDGLVCTAKEELGTASDICCPPEGVAATDLACAGGFIDETGGGGTGGVGGQDTGGTGGVPLGGAGGTGGAGGSVGGGGSGVGGTGGTGGSGGSVAPGGSGGTGGSGGALSNGGGGSGGSGG